MCDDRLVKVELSGVAMAATVAKMATAMSDAMIAYSIDVAPVQSRHKIRMALPIIPPRSAINVHQTI
jgi:hypothetical protein